ncbi:hypothetical protein [Neisseria musculi]|uniref:hypothetical protein n=1 Tax=Neisseria musculi TaxID=1815583 RepID=UPI00164A750D|nr:hypothetical protein [Neisseria musculi]
MLKKAGLLHFFAGKLLFLLKRRFCDLRVYPKKHAALPCLSAGSTILETPKRGFKQKTKNVNNAGFFYPACNKTSHVYLPLSASQACRADNGI